MNSKGFTLIEIIIVIVIIGVLATLSVSTYNRQQDQARAIKIVNDFKAMEKAWKTWKLNTGSFRYPYEDDTTIIPGGTQNDEMIAAGCTGVDEPEMSKTPIFTNTNYFDRLIRDPWQRGYAYDYDLDTQTAAAPSGGTNIMINYCGTAEQARYIRIGAIIDEMIDGGDGNTFGGKVYNDSTNQLWYNISRNGN